MQRKFLSRSYLIIIPLVASVIVASVFLLQDNTTLRDSDIQEKPKAAIIDQLYSKYPDESFQTEAAGLFKSSGYDVDIIKAKYVTVDFFRNLPSKNYKVIVIRAFTATEGSESVSIFTGEKYQENRYIAEQLLGQVQRGKPTDELILSRTIENSTVWLLTNETTYFGTNPNGTKSHNEYFVITPKFVKESMVGKFPETVILLGGSYTLENDSLAKSLIDRGAATIVGWDTNVIISDSDKIILALLENILIDSLEVSSAIELIAEKFDAKNLYYNATLSYYPRH